MHSGFEECAVVCYFSDSNEPSTLDTDGQLSIPTGKGKEDHLPELPQESPNNSGNQV